MDEKDSVDEKKEVMNAPQDQEHIWAILCHLSALALFIIPPIGQILGPLIIWLVKKNDMPRVDEEGKKALNFQASMTIYMFVAFMLCFVAIGIPILILLLMPLAILLLLANITLVIIASIQTSNKEKFQYPCTIRFIR